MVCTVKAYLCLWARLQRVNMQKSRYKNVSLCVSPYEASTIILEFFRVGYFSVVEIRTKIRSKDS